MVTHQLVLTLFTPGCVWELKTADNSLTVQNGTHGCINFFHHKDLGNHLLQLWHKVVKHLVYTYLETKQNWNYSAYPFLCFELLSLLAFVFPDSCLQEWCSDFWLFLIRFHTTLSGIIYDTCDAIWECLVEKHMPFPSTEFLEKGVKDYEHVWKN
jgi:hypothetical protein